MNSQIEEFKQTIVNYINESGMPIAITELVLQSILQEVSSVKTKVIASELKQMQAQKEAKEQETESENQEE